MPSTSHRCGRACRRGRGTGASGLAWRCGKARVEEHDPGPRRTSSSVVNLLTVPSPIRRRVPPHPLQDRRCVPWPSPCTPQASLDVTGRAVARPSNRDFVAPLRQTGSLPSPGAVLPGTLASPRADLHRLADDSLSLGYAIRFSFSSGHPSCWMRSHILIACPRTYLTSY
jgi:hypothetical protein